MEEPECRKSKINSTKSSLAKLLAKAEEPGCKGSETNNKKSILLSPKVEKAKPIHPKDLDDVKKPKCKESNTDSTKPQRAKLRADGEKPSVTWSRAKGMESRHPMPNEKKAKSKVTESPCRQIRAITRPAEGGEGGAQLHEASQENGGAHM